ncbi:MAG: helix-turn-helix transcriptional regulator [Rhodospirillales bacterium]|nr:helix-turn-helix transcriptional regulator [Rhodospirillales bacterium]
MSTSTKKHSSGCLVAYGLDTFGDRWTLLILRDMVLYGMRRYGQFLSGEEKIATNILADRLKHLEQEGIVQRARDPENRRSYIYSLTDKGLDLVPMILEIIRWGGKYTPLTPRRKKLVGRINDDCAGLLQEIRQRVQNPVE